MGEELTLLLFKNIAMLKVHILILAQMFLSYFNLCKTVIVGSDQKMICYLLLL